MALHQIYLCVGVVYLNDSAVHLVLCLKFFFSSKLVKLNSVVPHKVAVWQDSKYAWYSIPVIDKLLYCYLYLS